MLVTIFNRKMVPVS